MKYIFKSDIPKRKYKGNDRLHLLEDDYVMDSKVSKILRKMQKEKFSNEGSRRYFIELISALYNSRDRTARKIFKIIGKHLQSAIKEILNKYRMK